MATAKATTLILADTSSDAAVRKRLHMYTPITHQPGVGEAFLADPFRFLRSGGRLVLSHVIDGDA